MEGPTTYLVITGLVVLMAALVTGLWIRRRRRTLIEDTLASIAIRSQRDILVPDGMGGEIHLEHVLLTAKGILVVNVKRYEGVIFASDRMDQWTAIAANGRSTFQNPLPSLYDRVAAVRQVVRDVEVTGHVVFPMKADFSKGQPADVLLPDELVATYSKPEKSELSRIKEAFDPHWEKLVSALRPAT